MRGLLRISSAPTRVFPPHNSVQILTKILLKCYYPLMVLLLSPHTGGFESRRRLDPRLSNVGRALMCDL